ncbi:type II secretion system protein GspM [uncultured Abyssibacter sp.]|uniref:type II secretion system protein GspM n=1 Tax=uncultured Abyssibacter sp. TaxID=2320202 RepID=UPI0032B24038
MTPALESLKARYLALEPRERRLVSGGAAVLVALLYYLLIWEPLAMGRERVASQLEVERSLAAELAAAAPLARQATASSGAPTTAAAQNRSLLAVVDQTGKSAGLGQGVRRVQPEGDDRVRVWLEGVEFNRTVRWLHQLESRHGMTVDSADVGSQTQPGQVEARLGLARQ